MAENKFKTRIQLRRDELANYAPSFIPLKGELLFVNSGNRLRVKVGDGTSSFSSLGYLDNENSIIYWGYYLNEKFYTDSTYTVEIEKSIYHLYVDKNTNKLYIYNNNKFVCIDEMIPNATEEREGIMKLYKGSGQNEDGTMTQKAITDGIDDIEFSVDSQDSECLILSKPW